MASFNVSTNWGLWLAKKGFRVEPNTVPFNHRGDKQRPMRVFAPEGLGGKKAAAWFQKQFWQDHTWVPSENGCSCCDRAVQNFPWQGR